MEVDNFNLKDVLGLGDFRLQSFEAAEKWFALVVLAIVAKEGQRVPALPYKKLTGRFWQDPMVNGQLEWID